MNDQYNETITRNGKTYYYDPDSDIFYSREHESTVSRYAWIVVVIVMSIGCYYLEYLKSTS